MDPARRVRAVTPTLALRYGEEPSKAWITREVTASDPAN
jgi:hypothetical protein